MRSDHTHSLWCVSSPHTFLSVRYVFCGEAFFCNNSAETSAAALSGTEAPFFSAGESLDRVVCTLLLPDIPTPSASVPSSLSLPHVKDAEQDA